MKTFFKIESMYSHENNLCTDQKSREWNMEMVDVMTTNMGSGYLFLSAVRGNGYQGDIAIDNLKLRRGQCCPSRILNF